MTSSLPMMAPFVPLLLGSLAALVLRGHLRSAVMLLAPMWGALQLYGLEPGIYWTMDFMGYQLEPVRVDKLSIMFGYLFHLAAFIAVVYALHVKDTLQHVAGLSYAASAVGAVFAGDLLTLFVFWEMLALTSVFLIWARRTDRAYGAGTNPLSASSTAAEVIEAARNEYRKETACEGRWTEQLLRHGTAGEAVTIRDAAWDCPGMSLQFPNSETTASGFVLNDEGGCL